MRRKTFSRLYLEYMRQDRMLRTLKRNLCSLTRAVEGEERKLKETTSQLRELLESEGGLSEVQWVFDRPNTSGAKIINLLLGDSHVTCEYCDGRYNFNGGMLNLYNDIEIKASIESCFDTFSRYFGDEALVIETLSTSHESINKIMVKKGSYTVEIKGQQQACSKGFEEAWDLLVDGL